MTAKAADIETIYPDETRILALFDSPLSFGEVALKEMASDKATLYSVVRRLVDQAVRAEQRIAEAAEQIRSTLDKVEQHVKEGVHLNSLGELQRVPQAYDAAVAQREQALDALRLAVKAL